VVGPQLLSSTGAGEFVSLLSDDGMSLEEIADLRRHSGTSITESAPPQVSGISSDGIICHGSWPRRGRVLFGWCVSRKGALPGRDDSG
jgi:hypothetical protein